MPISSSDIAQVHGSGYDFDHAKMLLGNLRRELERHEQGSYQRLRSLLHSRGHSFVELQRTLHEFLPNQIALGLSLDADITQLQALSHSITNHLSQQRLQRSEQAAPSKKGRTLTKQSSNTTLWKASKAFAVEYKEIRKSSAGPLKHIMAGTSGSFAMRDMLTTMRVLRYMGVRYDESADRTSEPHLLDFSAFSAYCANHNLNGGLTNEQLRSRFDSLDLDSDVSARSDQPQPQRVCA
jgi:hypothetical protein